MICSAATRVGSWMYMVIFVGVCLDVLFSQYAVTVTVLSDTWDLKGCSENRKTVWKCDSASYKIYLAELRQLAAPGPSLAPHIDASRTSFIVFGQRSCVESKRSEYSVHESGCKSLWGGR